MTLGSDKKLYLVQTIIEQRNLYAIATDRDLSDPNETGELNNYLNANFSHIAELKAGTPTIDVEIVSPPVDITHYHIFYDAMFPDLHQSDDEKDFAIFDYDTARIPNDG
jgi:hypothetical protein